MSRIFADNSQSIGNTPLVKLNHVTQGAKGIVLGKVEGRNPSYSVKCRIGANLIWDAEQRGVLKPGEAKEPDWSDAIGRELVVEVEAQKYEDQGGQEKVGSQVSFSGFWSMGNKAVVNVPKDPTTPGMAGLASTVKTPKPLGSGTATTAKATTTATQAATATKPRASLADL